MERKKLGLPVTKDMAPHDAFTMKVPGHSCRVRAFSSSCANLVVIGCCAQSDRLLSDVETRGIRSADTSVRD